MHRLQPSPGGDRLQDVLRNFYLREERVKRQRRGYLVIGVSLCVGSALCLIAFGFAIFR